MIVSGVIFYQREEISGIIQKKINSINKIPNNLDLYPENSANEIFSRRWKTINSKWNPILPELEMKILEILFLQGSMNQQSLAEKFDVSKGTISRVISRLETKRLLFREQLGISKVIKINKERFPLIID